MEGIIVFYYLCIMKQQENHIAQLREAMEKKAGRQMHTPKDFDFLSESIFETLHQKVSATTLKRLWGYLQESSAPRVSTLDLLAQYVGYADWESFCNQEEQISGKLETPKTTPPQALHMDSCNSDCYCSNGSSIHILRSIPTYGKT